MAKKTALQAGELNWRQTRFVENYISNGGNATSAYLNAGFSRNSAAQNAMALLARPTIAYAIEQERMRLTEAIAFKREDALRILVGKATASIDDFAPLFKNHADQEAYKDLGYKRFALKSVKRGEYGVEIVLHDQKEALNELWDKLGLGEGTGKGNWFDGFEQLAGLVRGIKDKK